MKKRATVMATRFHLYGCFRIFYCCLRTQVVFSPNFSPNQTLLSPNFHCNECFKIVKMTSIVTLKCLLQRIKVMKKI